MTPLKPGRPAPPSQTPWGLITAATAWGSDGIYFLSTASHGGFYVPPAMNSRIPHAVKINTFRQQGLYGWYEEDCDAAAVVKAFPELFAK